MIERVFRHRAFAPVFAMLVATYCVGGVFTTTKIFYFRDLSVFHWPHHQWLHRTLLAGQSPFWDPNPGGGYSTVGDAALHVLFLPTLPLRLLPEIIGFNLAIALPFPIAALGVYLFARRHASAWASSVAAIAYAASGPVLSTGNCNNLAWCAAIIPFVFWAVDAVAEHPSARRIALLALLFGLELLAGEPVTLIGTAVLATAYATVATRDPEATWRDRARATGATIGAGLAGLLLAAAEALPLLDATRRSIRGSGQLGDTWSLHPMRLAETVLPFVYGNYLGLQDQMSPWLFALNSRREPFILSLYVGAFVLIVAAAGMMASNRRAWSWFWCAAIVVAMVCAFGSMTPIYPALQKTLPLLSSFRYPSKFVVLAMLPVAALVAVGWDVLTRATDRWKPAALAATVAAVVLVAGYAVLCAVASPSGLPDGMHAITGLDVYADTSAVTSRLFSAIAAAGPRLFFLIGTTAALVFLGRRNDVRSKWIRAAAIAIFTVDLAVANGGLNPTIDASLFDSPDWVAATRSAPGDRVHVAADFATIPGRPSPDGPPQVSVPADVPPAAYLAVWNTALCQYPSAWDVRQSLSLELTGLRPREYLTLLEQFTRAERSEQFRFLRYTGTRYAVVARLPPAPSQPVMTLPQLAPMQLFELGDVGSRVRVVTSATVEPDTDRAVAALFNPLALPESRVAVSAQPAAAGSVSRSIETWARIESETTTSVTARASAPEAGGYLVLLDSYDPGWTATVDGEDAEVVRAWGVYRAVRLAPGTHVVEFTYVSKPFRLGLGVSIATGLVLAAFAFRRTKPADVTSAEGAVS